MGNSIAVQGEKECRRIHRKESRDGFVGRVGPDIRSTWISTAATLQLNRIVALDAMVQHPHILHRLKHSHQEV